MGVQVQLYSSFNHGAKWRWVGDSRSRPLYPQEWARAPGIGGWMGRRAGLAGCGKCRRPQGFDLPTVQHEGFDLPTVQHVESRYTDSAIPAHTCPEYLHKTIKFKPICTSWYLKCNVLWSHTQQVTIYNSQYWRQNKGRSVNSFFAVFCKNTGIWNYSFVLFIDQFIHSFSVGTSFYYAWKLKYVPFYKI